MSTTSLDRHVVTGVLVAHDGARWLPETLKALLTQTRPVQRLVAVDTGSEDRGPAVLAEVVGDGNLLRLPRTAGYGEAVGEAVRHPAATLAVPLADGADGTGATEWIWLLHDDSAPAPNALELLLSAAETDPNIGLLGPKLRDWYDRRLLLEMGITIDGAGRRETGLDRDEFDQGQHDGVRDVLAVSSAGMLVRRDVWRELGGFDVGFGLFREDIDFGWRAHAAGHRVVAVSDAVMFHAEAAARGRREIGMTTESGRRLDRRNALYVLLGNLPGRPMFRALLRNVVGGLLRALFLMAAKRPDVARDEFAALGDVLGGPGRLRRLRSARAGNRKRVHRSVKRLMARRVVMRRVIDRIEALLSPEFGGRGDDHDDDGPPDGAPGPLRRLLTHPGVLVFLTLTAVALAAERSVLLAARGLGGGALVPAWGGATDLWAQYLTGWHPVGLGSDAQAAPYTGVLAVLSTLTFGKPWLAVAVLLLGSVPLAGLTAYAASRALLEPPPKGRRSLVAPAHRRIPAPVVRVWIAATYALLPVATGAIAGGRLGTSVVIVLLPLLGLLAARMFGLGPRPARRAARTGGRARRAASGVALLWDTRHETLGQRSRRSAWGFAFVLTVAMAFVPLTWLLALVMGVLAWVAFGAARPGLDRDLVIALGVPPLLLLPWTAGMLLHPSRFLLEAGLHRAELADARLSGLSLLTLDPGGPGAPRAWALYGLLLIAVLALPLRSRRAVVLCGWMVALFGLLTAVLVSAAVVTKGADRAPAWPGVALAFAAAGVMLAAIAAVQRAVDVLAGKYTIYRIGGAFVVIAALTAPVLSAVTWIGTGVRGPLDGVGPGVVPGFIADTSGPDGPPRVLVLNRSRTGRITYSVLRGVPPRIGEAELPTSEAARRRMDLLVGRLTAGRGTGGQELTRMGVHFVLAPRPARDRLTPALDAAPELTRFSRTGTYSMWRLVTPGSRLMLVDGPAITPLPVGRIEARVRVPAGTANRTLLLAEPADGGWRATIDGSELKATTVDGWAQGYRVPAAGGLVKLSRGMLWWHGWLVLQALGVLLTAALALPAGRVDGIAASARTRRRGRGRRAPHRVSALAGRTADEDRSGPGGAGSGRAGAAGARPDRAGTDDTGPDGTGTDGTGTDGTGPAGSGAGPAPPSGRLPLSAPVPAPAGDRPPGPAASDRRSTEPPSRPSPGDPPSGGPAPNGPAPNGPAPNEPAPSEPAPSEPVSGGPARRAGGRRRAPRQTGRGRRGKRSKDVDPGTEGPAEHEPSGEPR